MAKKFGKFLMFTAVAGAVAAGAYYYLQNKNSSYSDDLDDDDFDDFSDDLDDDADSEDSSRTYVDLPLEKAEEAVSETAGHLKDAAGDTAETVKEAAKDIAEAAQSKVEEFFDDDDDNSADSI